MTDLEPQTVAAVRALYREDPDAKQLFEWAASRRRDVTETSVDRMIQKLRIHRSTAIGLARKLEEAGCGDFVVGRRGSQSRLRWAYSLISLGKAAAGETEDLEEAYDPVSEEEETDQVSQGNDRHLTIQEAKRLLADSLGLEPSQIVIEIRA